MHIDSTSEFGQRVVQRLHDEQIIWLTTVDGKGTPQPVPVWFLWDGDHVLIFSQPDTAKLRNIARNARVSLSFNSTESGGNVVVFAGRAELESGTPLSIDVPEFNAKYRAGISGLQMTSQSFSDSYNVPIRVTLTKVRGH